MGKHSKQRRAILPHAFTKSRAPLIGVALIPVVGALTVAAGAHADQGALGAATPSQTHTQSATAAPSAQKDTEAPTKAPAPAQPVVATQKVTATPPPPPPLPATVTDGAVPQVAFEA